MQKASETIQREHGTFSWHLRPTIEKLGSTVKIYEERINGMSASERKTMQETKTELACLQNANEPPAEGDVAMKISAKAAIGSEFHKTFGSRALSRLKLTLSELRRQHAVEYDARSFGGKVSENNWLNKRYAVKLTRTIGETTHRFVTGDTYVGRLGENRLLLRITES